MFVRQLDPSGMWVALPLPAVIGMAAVFCLVVIVLGAALYRTRSSSVDGSGPNVPPLIYGANLTTVQPGAEKHPQLKRFGFFKRPQPQFIDPESNETKDYLGKVNFSLGYDREAHALKVAVLEAVDLPAKDITGSSDPYVRVCLLPDRKDVKVTKVHRRNLNPQFQQVLSFPGHSAKKLHDMSMCMQVMDFDRFSRDDPIGEILLPLKNVKFENAPVYWKHLQKPTVHKENVGELMLSLCYLPHANKVTVVVIKAKELPSKDVIGSSDPYVKLWLVTQGNKMEKRKTTVKSQTLMPVYNESFAFNVPAREVLEKEVHLVATVMDYDLISSNDEIGHVVLGSMGPENGAKHWKEMLDNAEHPSAMWHKLAPKW